MTLPVALTEEARREFNEAVDWYDDQKVGLGLEFFFARRRGVRSHFRVPAHPSHRVQECATRRRQEISYVVHYQVEAERVVVFSVFHSRRNPTIWKERVDKMSGDEP